MFVRSYTRWNDTNTGEPRFVLFFSNDYMIKFAGGLYDTLCDHEDE